MYSNLLFKIIQTQKDVNWEDSRVQNAGFEVNELYGTLYLQSVLWRIACKFQITLNWGVTFMWI